VVASGFVYKDHKLSGPVDMFDDPAYDNARNLASSIADYLRRMGPFEPHRLPEEDMEYTTLPKVMEKLKDRFEHVDAVEKRKSKNSSGREVE
jgi:Archaeal fructose 1,6-bisphosphatase